MLELDPQPRKTGRPQQPNVSISDHLAEYCLHLVERKSPQGFGSNVAARADAQRKCGRALVVRRLADGNDIVAAKRPVKVLDSDTAFLGHLLEFLSAADCILDLADALVSESGEHNERSHREMLHLGRPSNRCSLHCWTYDGNRCPLWVISGHCPA